MKGIFQLSFKYDFAKPFFAFVFICLFYIELNFAGVNIANKSRSSRCETNLTLSNNAMAND
jgi:hypothetical protein